MPNRGPEAGSSGDEVPLEHSKHPLFILELAATSREHERLEIVETVAKACRGSQVVEIERLRRGKDRAGER